MMLSARRVKQTTFQGYKHTYCSSKSFRFPLTCQKQTLVDTGFLKHEMSHALALNSAFDTQKEEFSLPAFVTGFVKIDPNYIGTEIHFIGEH